VVLSIVNCRQLKVPYSYNLYTVYGHGTHTVFV